MDTPHELHEYARSMFATYVSWFSFFVTINFVVAGWFAGKVLLRKPVSRLGISVTSLYFLTQGGISIIGTLLIRLWYDATLRQVLLLMEKSSPAERAGVSSIFNLYSTVFLLFAISLLTLVMFWIVIVAMAYFPKGTVMLFGRQSSEAERLAETRSGAD